MRKLSPTEKKDIHKKGRIILGTAGFVNLKTKGQHDVIRALGELKKRGDTNYEYQLVGLGDESFLRSIAKNTMLRMKWFFGWKNA